MQHTIDVVIRLIHENDTEKEYEILMNDEPIDWFVIDINNKEITTGILTESLIILGEYKHDNKSYDTALKLIEKFKEVK